MITVRTQVLTKLDHETNLDMTDFINNVKESFDKVIIKSISSETPFSRLCDYRYIVEFYHDLRIII